MKRFPEGFERQENFSWKLLPEIMFHAENEFRVTGRAMRAEGG
ncbi:MAG: hypothetical protein WDA07_00495 [Leucobacter sp.]